MLLWKIYGKAEDKAVKSSGFCVESIAKNKSLREIMLIIIIFLLFHNWLTEPFVFTEREKSLFLIKLH